MGEAASEVVQCKATLTPHSCRVKTVVDNLARTVRENVIGWNRAADLHTPTFHTSIFFTHLYFSTLVAEIFLFVPRTALSSPFSKFVFFMQSQALRFSLAYKLHESVDGSTVRYKRNDKICVYIWHAVV